MSDFVAIDVETANPFMGSICQIGAVRFIGGVEVAAIDWLIDPQTYFSDGNVRVHGISQAHVQGQPTFALKLPELIDFVGDLPAVSHTHFDRVSISRACSACSVDEMEWSWIDSARIARRVWPDVAKSGYGLANLAARFGVQFRHHNACQDARAAGLILLKAIEESGVPLADWPAAIRRRAHSPGSVSMEGGTGPLEDEMIVFTGELSMSRNDAAARANALGAAIGAGVTKKTTMLVVGDQDLSQLAGHSKSGKHRKAEELIEKGQAIRILAEQDFMALG